jgi:hypothetical protein
MDRSEKVRLQGDPGFIWSHPFLTLTSGTLTVNVREKNLMLWQLGKGKGNILTQIRAF